MGLFLRFHQVATAHSELVSYNEDGGKPHVPPYHHPLCLHAAQLHMLLSHSPTAKSSENHVPLALSPKRQHMGEKKGRNGHTYTDIHTHTHTQSSQIIRSLDNGQKAVKEWKVEVSGMWNENTQIQWWWKLVILERWEGLGGDCWRINQFSMLIYNDTDSSYTHFNWIVSINIPALV